MQKIDFSMENINKCLCKKCAVQIESQCVKDKLRIMLLITQQDLDSPMMMGPDRVPQVYCATGKATCRDLDTKKVCKCNECPSYGIITCWEAVPPADIFAEMDKLDNELS